MPIPEPPKAKPKPQPQATNKPLPDPIDWIQEYFFIPETNTAIVLEPYQQAVIAEALRRDANGSFVYSTILYSDIKKSAKSTIAAAVALYLAWHTPWETIRVVANDLRQANSRTFFYLERAIRLNPYLNAKCSIKIHHIGLPNHTIIEAIPVDPKGEAGGGDLMTCFTELWAAKNDAALRLWSETTLSPLKFGQSIRWAESYAGFVGASPILEQLYETGKKQGEVVDVGIPGLELYSNASARMLTLWNTVPRCTWQTPEYYQQEAASLTPDEFQRMHRNQWSEDTDTFIPVETWNACGDEQYDAVYPGEPVVIAADAGVVSDNFAVVVVTKRSDKVQVHYARIWQPVHGEKLDYSVIETEIRRLVNTYNAIELAYDEFQLHSMMGRIRAEESVNCRVFNQASPRAVADKRLYDMIMLKRIQHGNKFPDLSAHVMNSNRKPEEENKLRLVKRAPHLKIDACVCLSMACDRAHAYAFD